LPTVGLSMIVKNGGKDLRPCLESVRSLVSQIVIADTGSTDDTLAIAAEFGAEVVPCAWNDHFADARNAALAPMTTDWVLVLDADEELAPDAPPSLLRLIEQAPEEMGGCQVPIRNYNPEPYTLTLGNMSRRNTDTHERAKPALSHTEHRMTRLFRRRPEIRFVNRVHEQVDARILEAGMKLAVADFRILHFGNLRPSAGKRTYYRKLGRQKISDNPNDEMAWFEAGGEEFTAKNYARALRYLEKSWKLKPATGTAYLIAQIHRLEGRFTEALAALERISAEGAAGISRFSLEGEVLEGMGKPSDAENAYQEALRLCVQSGGEDELSVQTLIESRLGMVEVLLGRAQDGIPRLEAAIAKLPSVVDLHDRLVKAWLVCRRDDKAAEAQERLIGYWADETSIARAAVLRLKSGNPARANAILRKGLELLPDSKKFRALLGTAE
jgi:tetratricopeptide (TPR) repeat protein